MLQFETVYLLWRRLPFPRAMKGDATLIEIHSDLALADEYVTTVIRFVEEGIHRPAVPDVLGLLRQIRSRLDKVIDGASAERLTIAREQRAYAVLLEAIYEQFLAMAPKPDGP